MLKVRPLRGRKSDVLEILESLQLELGLEPDCISSEIYEPHADDGEIFYMELWRTREALHHYIESDLYRRILMVMELGTHSPLIWFPEFTDVNGMDLIMSLRGGFQE